MNAQKVYTCHPSDDFLFASFGKENSASEVEKMENERLIEAQPVENWSKWAMNWIEERRGEKKPDVTIAAMNVACSQTAATGLWPQSAEHFELLPIEINEECWYVLRPLHWANTYEPTKSRIVWFEWNDSDGKKRRQISDIPWINIVDSRALQWDAFKLGFRPRSREVYTQRFVDRYEALGLKGVYFQHVGYVVASAEYAIPEPPRPAPEVPQAPRWPRWREAPVKEKASVESSGLAWLEAKGLNAASSAEAVLAAITAEVETLRPVRATLKPKARNALFNGVGGAFALLLERDLQWRWVDLPVSSRSWGLGMASPNGSHALCLDQVTLNQVMSPEPPTITLLFNMIAAGNLPPGNAGDHVVIG